MRKASDKEVVDGLIRNKGLVAKTARELGMTHQALFGRINRNPKLKSAHESISEFNLDQVEDSLQQMINSDHNVTAAIFYLKCKGKKRGWIENEQQTDHIGDINTTLKDIAAKLPN